MVEVKEYKRKCNECGKVWHSLVSREEEIRKSALSASTVQAFTACGGALGTSAQSQRNADSQIELLNKLRKCPECGSTNYKEEIKIYEKKKT